MYAFNLCIYNYILIYFLHYSLPYLYLFLSKLNTVVVIVIYLY